MHDTEKYNTYMREWYENIVKLIKKSNKSQMRNFLHMHKLDIQRCDSAYIKYWNLGAMKMFNSIKEEILNDI